MQSSLNNSDNYQSVLSHVLRLLRFRANVFFQSNYCGEWVASSTGTGRCTFHVVDGGDCWLHMPILSKPLKLKNGDLLLFPHDALHVICDNEVLPAESIEQKKLGTEGKVTALICGYFEYSSPQANPIIQALPEWILVNGEDGMVSNWLGEIIAIMQREAGEKPCGFESVVDRLSEVLFISVVRHYLGTARPQKGILGALLDVRIGDALRAFHKHPGDYWTVDHLAMEANMSRAAFAALFAKVMKQTPMQYVTHWRMQMAYAELLESRRSVLDIAEMVGYSSEAAFRKAFKQVMGITPGNARSIAS